MPEIRAPQFSRLEDYGPSGSSELNSVRVYWKPFPDEPQYEESFCVIRKASIPSLHRLLQKFVVESANGS